MPLALPIGCIFFMIKYYIDKYNMIYRYRIEYEANAYIRTLVCVFTVFSIGIYQIVMVIAFMLCGSDEMIICAFLLLILTILPVYYFISTETWKGKKEKPQPPKEIYDEDEKSDDSCQFNRSIDLKLKKKSSSAFGSVYKNDRLQVEGMTPPTASPFQAPMYSQARTDAYLHP